LSKKLFLISRLASSCAVALLYLQSSFAQTTAICVMDPNKVADSVKGSVYAKAVVSVGSDSIRITYHSPAVRKRIIWGGLVPYGEVWVTGAHNATTLETSRTLLIGGQELTPGKYALFTIPGPEEWIVIINKNWNQHLAWDYNSKEDVLRFSVKPQPADHLERLQYFITMLSTRQGRMEMRWERMKIEWNIVVKQ
jgi:Protein of unknown function (DUF2911)